MKRGLMIAVVEVAVALAGTWAHAQETSPKEPADCVKLQQDFFIDLKEVVKAGCTPSEAQIRRLLDNPVGNFVAIPLQYDYVQLGGPEVDDTKVMHRLQITPTFPLSLGSDWNLINRVVLPVLSLPINEGFGDCIGLEPGTWINTCPSFPDVLADPFARTSGFGDMVYVGLASPKKAIKIQSTGGAVIWGGGATTMLPTASDEVLGTGKFGLGPAAVIAYLGPKWSLGIFAQHWWSAGGDSKRHDISLTNLQYFIYYAPPWDPKAQWRIGVSPNISIDWKAEGDRTSLPVGLGISRMVQIGKLPVSVTVEADYAVVHPGDKPGSRWDFRVYFTPVIPTFMF